MPQATLMKPWTLAIRGMFHTGRSQVHGPPCRWPAESALDEQLDWRVAFEICPAPHLSGRRPYSHEGGVALVLRLPAELKRQRTSHLLAKASPASYRFPSDREGKALECSMDERVSVTKTGRAFASWATIENFCERYER